MISLFKKKKEKAPEFELYIEGMTEGIEATALVHDPANQTAFLAFSKEDEAAKISLSSDEQRIVTGVLLIPEQKIFRKAIDGTEYFVSFTQEDIRMLAKAAGKNNFFNRINSEHDANKPLLGISMMEVWLTGNSDKAVAMGFGVPEGTYMASFHVHDDALWQQIKEGKYTGFSIEGFFQMREKMSAQGKNEELAYVEDMEVNNEKLKDEVKDQVNTDASTEVDLTKDAPATPERPAEARPSEMAEILSALKALGDKLEATSTQMAEFRSQIDEINSKSEKLEGEIVELSKQPEGPIAGKEKEEFGRVLKHESPLVARVLARSKNK